MTENFTPIPNKIIAAVMLAGLSGVQMRVFIWVARNSYGWQRKRTEIINKRTMAKETNTPRSSIILALQVLIEAGILQKDDKNRVCINQKVGDWIPLGGQPTDRGVSPLTGSEKPQKGVSPLTGGGQPTDPSPNARVYKENNLKKEKKGSAPGGADGRAYEIKTDLQRIVCAYKVVLGFKLEDRAWDKANFNVWSKSGRKLLDAFDGSVDEAVDWLANFGAAMEKAGRSWTLATAARIAWDEKPKRARAAAEDVWEESKEAESAAGAWDSNGSGL